jgi:hypothetical protein
MSYNKKEFPKLMQTAGKITILTALVGVAVFIFVFLFDAGTTQLKQAVAAGTATTTLTVLNTPPAFTLNTYEVTPSSTTTPTNSGTAVQWRAIAVDSNGAPYFLLVCSTNATPTAHAAASNLVLGTVPPTCGAGANKWAVSAGVASGVAAVVSTTTQEYNVEQNNWYSWVCDDDPVNPRCNNTPVQGYSATNSSPFYVNHRPVFTNAYNNGPKNPGQVVSFNSTSSDPDVVGGADKIYLIVCQNNGGVNSVTRKCTSGGDVASTSGSFTTNVSASYTLASILRDDVYPAYSYLVDEHGHTATANPRANNFTVSNVAPVILSGDIILNNGSNITLTVPANETTGFSLKFKVRDNNSCKNAANGSEIASYKVALHRSGVATTTCTGLSGSYNPNSCYPSAVSTAVWNLSCTASTTSCTGPTDIDVQYDCTFPLWFVADPTDSGAVVSPHSAENWVASVSATDDNAASSPLVNGSSPVELISFTALDLITLSIPYGALEPGTDSGTLNASTTVRSVGNTGLDEQVSGESMCGTFSLATKCKSYATSTVTENKQKFSSSSLAYSSGAALTLSSTTPKRVEINVAKTISTTTPNKGYTYFGIAVPIAITLAGSYQGLNTFYGVTAQASDW